MTADGGLVSSMESLGLITSTGRTGTQFFSYFINTLSQNAVCLHEPTPSRRFKFYSNLFLDGRIRGNFVAREYARCRRSIIGEVGGRYYIESNNFLFGCIQPLARQYRNFRILHVVREPKAYIISHLKHGFWLGLKRVTAQYVPYWLEKTDLAPADRRNPVRILANRWVYVNEAIARRPKDVDYLMIRFEDLFNKDHDRASETLHAIIGFFKLDIKSPDHMPTILKHKKNVGRKSRAQHVLSQRDERYVASTCRRLAQEYGYETSS